MREDPLFSGGAFKVVLVLLVAVLLGGGAYAIAGGGLDIDLPDFPEIETPGGTTNLENTALEDTTIGDDLVAEGLDPFSSVGFAEALALVRDEAGSGRQLTRLFVNPTQTQFIVRTEGDNVEAYSVRTDSGELVREEASVTISGDAALDDFAFALDAVDPAAVDRMLDQARRLSGAPDFEPTVLSLERAIPFGRRALEWTINAQGGKRNLLYRAAADGRKVRDQAGGGTAIPPAAIEAQELNECIQAAENDPEQIFACLEEFQ
jgi:hypothetical protein